MPPAIAASASGFIYQIAVAGTTGERQALPSTLPDEVNQLRKASGLPIAVGFGVSTADHVRAVCRVADGAIVGSALIRRIADGMKQGWSNERIIESTIVFLSELMTGIQRAAGLSPRGYTKS